VINVGAATETEMKEKKARVEDALHATRAAVEEGIVPGGGVALLWGQRALDKMKTTDEDEQIGIAIVRRAIEEPIRMIVQNAGAEGAIVVGKIRESKDKNFGFNARRASSRIWSRPRHRPDKVTRTALQNAASIAACSSRRVRRVEKKEKEKAPPMPGAAAWWDVLRARRLDV